MFTQELQNIENCLINYFTFDFHNFELLRYCGWYHFWMRISFYFHHMCRPLQYTNHFSKIDTTLYTTNIPRMQHLLTQKMYTLENSWRVSFSKTGACWRIHANAHTSGTHQHSLSNNFFNCLNIGQCFKSLLKINWTGWNKKRVKWSLYDWHNDCLLYNKVNMYTAIKKII